MADENKDASLPPPTPLDFAKGAFVAVGHRGQRVASADGKTWVNLQLGQEGEVLRQVAFGNGRFVGVGSFGGDNLFASTKDGAAWEVSKRDAQYSRYIRGLGFGDGRFVGLGGDPVTVGDAKPFLVTSPDGVAWGDPQPLDGKNMLRRVAWGGGRYVAVGDRGRRATSADGKQWTDAQGVRAVDTLIDVAFGKGVFVGVGLHGLRMTSADGVDWSRRFAGEEGQHLNTILWTGDRFVAIGMGVTYFSPDGIAWDRKPNADAPLTAAYGNGAFVGTNWKGRILRSADAVGWTEVHRCDEHLESVAFGKSA